MKKTISINIAGVIFYIEEDGYDKLKSYLNSVHKYFSTFSDSAEILADIEGRIAERFLVKQKLENKQAISESDVSELITAMGTVSDFEAIETADDLFSEPLQAASSKAPPVDTPTPAPTPPKRRRGQFFRDLNRKMLGGVAAGLAHYYSVDPLWIRLLILLVVFGLVPASGILDMHREGTFAFLSGIVLLVYIAMWVAFPGSRTLEDNTAIKKFYRNPDRKVIGGVASGVGSYFNIDVGVVRFLWVLSILFFGTGILVYIILWAIAPAANTLTEKMEMQGEPITLSNIESNIKRSLRLEDNKGKESDLMKVLLLPFRAIAYLLTALGKILKGLGPILRVLIGVFLIGTAGLTLLGLFTAAAIFMGLTTVADLSFLPAHFMVFKEMPALLVLAAFVVSAVPVLSVLLLGLMLLTKRSVVGSTVWITLAGLWIAGIIGTVSTGITFQRNFAKRGGLQTEAAFRLSPHVLKIDQLPTDPDESVRVNVVLKGMSLSDSIRVAKYISAYGASRNEAEQNASEITYAVTQKDSILFFPEGPFFSKSLPYRKQRIEITLHIPYHKSFAMSRNFFFGMFSQEGNHRNLRQYHLSSNDLNWDELRWAFLPDSGLVCRNIPPQFLQIQTETAEETVPVYNDDNDPEVFSPRDKGEFSKQFAVSDFDAIDLGGAYHILIQQGNEWSLTADGSQADIEKLTPSVQNGILRVRNDQRDLDIFSKSGSIGLVITLPELKSLDLSGANRFQVSGFNNIRSLEVELSGATRGEMHVSGDALQTDLSGASRLILKGVLSELEADLSGASKLEAVDAQIRQAHIEASGASTALMGNIPDLKSSVTGASNVTTPE